MKHIKKSYGCLFHASLPTLCTFSTFFFSDVGAINETALQVSLHYGPGNSPGYGFLSVLISLFAVSVGMACERDGQGRRSADSASLWP